MTDAPNPILAKVTRGPFVESVHRGAAVICGPDGAVVEAWGEVGRPMLPRSACKMLQALPLVESGAADAAGLGAAQLALACASHQGGAMHTEPVRRWLAAQGLSEADLRCGPQTPADREAAEGLIRAGAAPDQTHNNCSGKHVGFLTLSRRLGGGPEYVDPDHPVQRAVKAAFYEMTGDDSALGHGVDGCSAPNFAATLRGFAGALARMARPDGLGRARAGAARRLTEAMMTHPALVAGEGRACTGLMTALGGAGAVKTGAEGVFAAMLPDLGLGIAVKIDDGATRAAEVAMAALLVRVGALAADHPGLAPWREQPQVNRRGIVAGVARPAAALA